MHVYDNLKDDVKRVFLFRVVYSLFLTISNIYSITILSVGYYDSWVLVVILILNFLSFFNSLIHVWSLIYTNDLYQTHHCIFTIDLVNGVIVFTLILVYFIAVSGKPDKEIHELIFMVIYGIIYFGIAASVILYFLGALCYVSYKSIIKTAEIIEERHKSYSTFS